MTAADVAVPGLRRRILRGSVFELGGYGATQVLRFASNLILTRLLYPAAFGQATIVSTISIGLVMLSDVAIQPCVIQSKRGDESAFLNTAFTLQVLRGFGLALLMVLVAKPVSWFYREPALTPLICLGGIQLVFNGFHSTSVFTLRRKLAIGWVSGLDFATSALSTVLVVLMSKAHPTPTSLVLGGVIGSSLGSVMSHFLPVPYRNRFAWDKDAVQEIGRFGRWVFGSSATSFLGGQSDRILLGRFLGTAWLGIYGIAVNLSDMLSVLIGRLISGVLYPVLSEAGRTASENIGPFFYRLRLRLDALSMTATGLLAGLGPWVVRTLWDARYADAAWIVRLLAIRVAITLLVAPTETVLFALGQTRVLFARSMTRLIGSLIFIPVGWYLGGVKGVIWATALAEAPTILAVWPLSRSMGILRLRREALGAAIFVATAFVAQFAASLLPNIHLR